MNQEENRETTVYRDAIIKALAEARPSGGVNGNDVLGGLADVAGSIIAGGATPEIRKAFIEAFDRSLRLAVKGHRHQRERAGAIDHPTISSAAGARGN